MIHSVTVTFIRLIRMFAEPLVLFTDLFLLYQYSILYLYFEAYPIIFKGRSSQYVSIWGERYLTRLEKERMA